MKEYFGGRVLIKTGDITRQMEDAIVNAANSSLMGGAGVDGAIHRNGGPAILEECKKIRARQYPDGLPTGKAVTTTGGFLSAKAVIHTVGPIWHGGGDNEDKLLADCYRNCLSEAKAHGFKAIAFPAISTGVYGFPKDRAAKIAGKVVKDWIESDDTIKLIVMVFYSESDEKMFITNCGW